MSGSRRSEARSFNENSPRPPVPGEETEGYVSRYRPQSPVLTPRRSSLASRSAQDACDASAPLGFEPEGCCGTTTMETYTPPACLRWAKNVYCLLKDHEGSQLFTRYLDQEGESVSRPLYFWYACEGLKNSKDPATIQHLIKVIHRRFFVKSQLAIDKDVRQEAHRRVMEGRADNNVFDAVQSEVEQLMAKTTYPNFLQSDMYLQYVQSCQNPDYGGGCPSSDSSREVSVSCGPTPLPTLHEDSEFVISGHGSRSANETPVELRSELRLTKDVLRATQNARALEIRPEPEAYAGYYLQPGTSPYHMSSKLHAQYSSYNPVSRQDSEVQSLSSDARTGSNLSLTDSSVDGMSIGKPRSKKPSARRCRAIPESVIIHPDPMPEQSVIPRTQRISRDAPHPQPPMDFAKLLAAKLEDVQREREENEKAKRKLQEDDSAALRDAFSAKGFLFEDDNGQAILDEHVSRVWSDPTPSRSPEFASPRPHSPDARGSSSSRQQQPGAHNYMRQLKQRKDSHHVVSTFSVDSGNIQDFAEGSELLGAGSMSSLGSHIPKSKSVPSDHADSLYKQDLYLQGHEQRLRRSDVLRRSATKKSMTELTDSGVSVVSYAPSTVCSKDSRPMMRHSQCEKKVELKHSSGSGRHAKSGRSGSLERTSREKSGIHIHPFVADPGMPPLPGPEPAMLIDEAKRRLEEEEKARACSRQRHAAAAGKHMYEPALQSQSLSAAKMGVQSNQSTLRKSRQDSGDFTTAVFTFCDEPLAYRTKIPGRNVTLKQFKEYLPKKGSYRFFFKTECEDVDMKVIQEEITNDAKVLPLWEGKVMAKVMALE